MEVLDELNISEEVEEELPLKQGLKLFFQGSPQAKVLVEEELPLKQGLKHSDWCRSPRRFFNVEEELPLKQGLKLIVWLMNISI